MIHRARPGPDFEPSARGCQVSVQTFDLGGLLPWFSGLAVKPMLTRIKLAAGAGAETEGLPLSMPDAIACSAQNPTRRKDVVIATFKRSVYIGRDDGRTSQAIAIDGAARQAKNK